MAASTREPTPMTEHAQNPAKVSTDIMVMDRVRDMVGYLPPDEQVLAAVSGRATATYGHANKTGLLAATTHRLLFHVSKAAPTGPAYDELDGSRYTKKSAMVR
jgi:hypothetical protein